MNGVAFIVIAILTLAAALAAATLQKLMSGWCRSLFTSAPSPS